MAYKWTVSNANILCFSSIFVILSLTDSMKHFMKNYWLTVAHESDGYGLITWSCISSAYS